MNYVYFKISKLQVFSLVIAEFIIKLGNNAKKVNMQIFFLYLIDMQIVP